MRPTCRMPAVMAPPVLPADTNACASPRLTILQPTTIELSGLVRTACAGLSSISITCVAGTIGRFSPAVLCFFKFGFDHVRLADEGDGHAIFLGRLDGPCHDGLRRVVATHCV